MIQYAIKINEEVYILDIGDSVTRYVISCHINKSILLSDNISLLCRCFAKLKITVLMVHICDRCYSFEGIVIEKRFKSIVV